MYLKECSWCKRWLDPKIIYSAVLIVSKTEETKSVHGEVGFDICKNCTEKLQVEFIYDRKKDNE